MEEPTIEQARDLLYRKHFQSSDPPRWRDPGTELGSERMDADVRRLVAMTPIALYADQDALATLLEIGDFQGWT